MKVYLASANPHKLKEVRHILKGIKVEGLIIKVKENQNTFEGNALKKVRTAAKISKHITLADDSGLMVDALGGKPGVRSARFVSGKPTAEKLSHKILKLMQDKRDRRAKFVCVVAISFPSGKDKIIRGEVKGRIAFEIKGTHGFGYDPVFIPSGYDKTFAQITPSQKNKISHRAKAFSKARDYLLKFAV